MSEKLLKSLMQLFAIIAKQEGVSGKELDVIQLFLKQQLNREAVEEYMKLFHDFAAEEPSKPRKNDDEKGSRRASVKESARILRICTQINKELTQKQKIVVMFRLFELINADKTISEQESEFVTTVAETFNISNAEFNSIKQFVISDNIYNLDIPEVLVVDNKEKNTGKNRKHVYSEYLSGIIAVLRIPSVEMYMTKYLGDTEVYLNGLVLNSEVIYSFPSGSVVRVPRGSSIYYSDVVSKFLSDEATTKISFEAKRIEFKFPNGKIGLRNVNIAEESGKLMGFMGGSGAGKTTLLSVLNGNETPSSGEVLINGINAHTEKEKIEGVVGYVPQDDLLIEDLSVYQNLFYAAKLCFKSYTDEQIDALVNKTLNSLGLLETKHLKVGSPLQKTISGGQRKRLNIGLELLREPSILFVDEPTSGLSSRDSENIMDLLKELSLRGKLIFVVIHQPSSDIFKMFDKLLILDVGGYPIYYGNPVEAVIYFKRLANQINSEQGECIECGNVNPEQIFNIIETKVVDEYGMFTDLRKVSPQHWNDMYNQNVVLPKIKASPEKPPSTLDIPSKFKQLKVFIKRDLLSKLSNKQYLVINLTEAPALAIILGFIVRYYNVDESNVVGYIFSQNENLPAYIFMSIIVALFMGLTVSAEEIIKDSKILKREAFLNLSRKSYLFSKMCILFSLSAIQTLCYVLVGNLIIGIPDMNFTYWLVLFSTSCFANMLGLNISATFNSAVTIYILIPILLIPQLILSGVIVKFDKLNPWISSPDNVPMAGEIMASRWAYEALSVSQYKNNSFEKQFYHIEKEIGMSEYKNLYYISRLNSKIDYCITNINEKNEEVKKTVEKDLVLLKNEIAKEIKNVKMVKFDNVNDLEVSKFTFQVGTSCKTYLDNLKRYYIKRNKFFTDEKDDMISKMQSTPEKKKEFLAMRDAYHNEKIEDLVKNKEESNRTIEKDGRIIQKIYSIFRDPDNYSNILDFRAHFFAPRKHFLGKLYDTLYVNVLVIWFMSAILYVTLYFDLFKKSLNIGEIVVSKFKKKQ